MSYAAPFYYAAKAIQAEEPSSRHPQPLKQRRRRIRLVLFPAQRAQRQPANVAVAPSGDC